MSRFFATGDTSSEEEYSEEVSAQEDTKFEKVSNVKGFIDSSSDEDDNRVVRSTKDKQFDDLEKSTKDIKKDLKDNDWISIAEHFDELQKKLLKAANIIKTHGFPRFYSKCVVDLEAAANELNNDKDAKAELDKEDQRSHGLVLLKVRKHIQQFAKQIDAYKKDPDVSEDEAPKKAAPAPAVPVAAAKKAPVVAAKKPSNAFAFGDSDDDEEEEEEEPVNKRLPPPAKKPSNAFAFGDESEEEDEDDEAPPTVFTDDEMDMPEDEAEPESEIDDDIDDVSLISDKITRDFWVKKDKKVDPAEEKKKEKVRRPKEKKQEDVNDDEDGTPLTKAEKQRREMIKARANEEVSPAVMAKRIREIVASRGKRSVDQNAIINELRFLETKAHDAPTLLRVQTLLALFLFDHYSRRGGSMPIDEWRDCIAHTETILKTLNSNPAVRLVEDDSFNEAIEDLEDDSGVNMEDFVDDAESTEWYARRTKMIEEARAKAAQEVVVEDNSVTYVEGNLYSFVFKVSSEYAKSLRLVENTSPDYIARLKEQPRLVNLFKAARAYYQTIHKPRLEARIVQLWIEYEYYYYQSKYDVLAGASESTPTLVDELANVAYISDDPRSRVRALLFQCYFWCVHNRYDQARERLLMSHIQEAINDLDTSTRILYNRTLVQLGLAAFRRGEYRAALNCLGDICTNLHRVKVLLAQGVKNTDDMKEEELAEAIRRLYPYHMHINIDLIEAAHLISALIVEIPNIAEAGWSRRAKSVTFRKLYQAYLAYSAYSTKFDSSRDIIMSAAKALADGNWKKSYDDLTGLKFWNCIQQSAGVKSVLMEKLKREALRSYLLTNGSHYSSISLDTLKEMFALDEETVMQLTSKMVHCDLIPGAWDVETIPCLSITAPPTNKIQKLSLQFVDKIQQFSERIEVAPQRNMNKNDDGAQNKQKWGDNRRNKPFANTNRSSNYKKRN